MNGAGFGALRAPAAAQANNIAIYGGRDNAVTDNLLSDSIMSGGALHVGNRFSSYPLSARIAHVAGGARFVNTHTCT